MGSSQKRANKVGKFLWVGVVLVLTQLGLENLQAICDKVTGESESEKSESGVVNGPG